MFDDLINNGFNIEIDCAGSGANTLRAVAVGRRLVVFSIWMQAEADVTAQIRSGAVDLTGPINLYANVTNIHNEVEFKNAGCPVFKTVASGEDLILNLSGAVQVNGTAFAVEIQA